MAKPRNKILDHLTYVVLRLLTAFLQALPLERAYWLAGSVGNLMFRVLNSHRARAEGHIRRSFPDWTDARVRSVARASMRSLAYTGLELMLSPRLITPTRWQEHIELGDIDETMRMLVERKTGLILVTGHFGNWEVLGYSLAVFGFPNVAIARPLDNPHVDRYVRGLRERAGLRILDKKGAAAEMGDILDAHLPLDFIADQDAGRKGLFVDFFGRPASTYKAIALMAMRHEVPIVVGYCRRLGPRFRFEIGASRIIHPEHWADKPDPLRWITETYTRNLEEIVRSDPSQYLWAHRRWKHRPKGEAKPADGIA